MKLLTVIMSFLGLGAYGQFKASVSMENSEHVQRQETVKEKISLNSGCLILFGRYCGSVGITYNVECDSTSFVIRRDIKYETPEAVKAGMCGSDDSTITYTLIPKKRGVFEIFEVFGFRGSETKRVTHIVTVW